MATVRFYGYGPEPSVAQLHLTTDGRVVLMDSPLNNGTSLVNALSSCISVVYSQYDGLEEDAPFFLWTPNDRAEPQSMWKVTLADDDNRGVGNEYDFEEVDWKDDEVLKAAIDSFDNPPLSEWPK